MFMLRCRTVIMLKVLLLVLILAFTQINIPLGHFIGYGEAYEISETETALRNEIPKYYPLAQIQFIQKVWDKKEDNQTLQHYVVTISDSGKQKQLNATVIINKKGEISRIQILKSP